MKAVACSIAPTAASVYVKTASSNISLAVSTLMPKRRNVRNEESINDSAKSIFFFFLVSLCNRLSQYTCLKCKVHRRKKTKEGLLVLMSPSLDLLLRGSRLTQGFQVHARTSAAVSEMRQSDEGDVRSLPIK